MSKELNQVILSSYCGQYPPADEKSATVRKTSEEIVLDLRPIADVSKGEIAEFLALNGYTIGFDGDTPVWCMTTNSTNELKK